jgi:YVTN family beta-propeller protein
LKLKRACLAVFLLFGLVPTTSALARNVYVANAGLSSVSVIDTATNRAGQEIGVGREPFAIAITPDGSRAYVTNFEDNNVSVINTATNQPVGNPIPVGEAPEGIAITPDGSRAYVTNRGDKSVSVINTATNQPLGSAISVNNQPAGIAIVPDQPPVASFSTPRARPGVPLSLDASSSKDPDSAIATYAWTFGDGQGTSASTPSSTHPFAKPGTYTVSLQTTDAEGCSTVRELVFTGQTAMGCNGNAVAQITKTITVAYPGVRIRCPKSAKPRGCAFKLQVVVKKPKKGKKTTPESALAKARVKADRSAIVSLLPKKAFAAKLAAAKSVLVKETVVAGRSTTTRFARLKIVQ